MENIRKEADEAHHSLDQQKDKKLQDALKMNEELKRKLEQGSQQSYTWWSMILCDTCQSAPRTQSLSGRPPSCHRVHSQT